MGKWLAGIAATVISAVLIWLITKPPQAPAPARKYALSGQWRYQMGDKELALQQLEVGLRAPNALSMLSYGALKLFPDWDPLRGDPGFEKIVASLAPKKP